MIQVLESFYKLSTGLAVKAPWLGPGGPILVLTARTGLENASLTLFISGREGYLGSERVHAR